MHVASLRFLGSGPLNNPYVAHMDFDALAIWQSSSPASHVLQRGIELLKWVAFSVLSEAGMTRSQSPSKLETGG